MLSHTLDLASLASRLPSRSHSLAASVLVLALLVGNQLASNLVRRRRLIAQGIPFLPHTSLLHYLRGHLNLLASPSGAIDASVALVRQLGSVFVTTGVLGRPTLWIADPVALRVLMLTKARAAGVERTAEGRKMVAQIVGWRSLLTLEGEEHRMHRKLMDPAFNLRNLTPLVPVISHITDQLISILATSTGHPVDLVPLALGTTLNIIGQTAAETDFDALNQTHPSALLKAYTAVFSTAEQTPLSHLRRFVPMVRHLPLRGNWDYAASLARVRHAVEHVIGQYAGVGTPAASEDARITKGRTSLIATLHSLSPSGQWTHADLGDELMSVLLAGHETTAISFTMAVHELGRHPEVLLDLHTELVQASVAGSVDHFFSSEKGYTTLAGLPLLNAVINETLRLHHPVGFVGRQLTGQPTLDLPLANGRVVRICEGQRMMIPYHAFGRLPDVWGADVDEWKPSRWFSLGNPSDEAASPMEPLTPSTPTNADGVPLLYLPFGTGSHGCIGRKLATLNLRVLIARMVLAFEWESLQDTVKKRSFATALPVEANIRVSKRAQ